jgi:hypothetical protein
MWRQTTLTSICRALALLAGEQIAIGPSHELRGVGRLAEAGDAE